MANLNNLTINDGGFLKIPLGNSNQRPQSPQPGSFRVNSDTNLPEFYSDKWTSSINTNMISRGLVGYYNTNLKSSFSFQSDHGINDWVCVVDSTTIHYAIPYPGTDIVEVTPAGTSTTLVSNAGPTSGTISTVAGNRYYGTKPVHFMGVGQIHHIIPTGLQSNLTGYYANRYSNSTTYLYSPYGTANVSVYDAVADGINGTPTSTISISANSTQTYVTPTLNNWVFFESDRPIIASKTGSSGDRMILSPAAYEVFRRRDQVERTVSNSAPSYTTFRYVTDSSERVLTVEIADGSGGDCTTGIGIEHLSTEFAIGPILTNYEILAPYTDTEVEVRYYNSGWTTYATYSLSGTKENPDYITVGNTTGSGAELSNGVASPWHIRSNKPIAVFMNETADDEEQLFGWNNFRHERLTQEYYPTWYDVSGFGNHASVQRQSKIYRDKSGFTAWEWDIEGNGAELNKVFESKSITVEVWIYPFTTGPTSDSDRIVSRDRSEYWMLGQSSNNNIEWTVVTDSGLGGDRYFGPNALNINAWNYLVGTYNGNTGTKNLYINGSLAETTNAGIVSSSTLGTGIVRPISINSNVESAVEYNNTFKGRTSIVRLYNVDLSSEEVKQNFEVTRGQFGV